MPPNTMYYSVVVHAQHLALASVDFLANMKDFLPNYFTIYNFWSLS